MATGMIIYMSACGLLVLLTIFAVAVALALLVLWCAYLVWAETQKEYEL
jgi:hypothetical protein|nr:MAG TPA: hypothetical protein [Bacteriophage sp.]